MAVEHVNPDTLFHLPGFSQIVIGPPGRLAFIAGQPPLDTEFRLIGGNDLFAQTVRCFRNLKLALAAVGATPQDVVSSTIYVAGLDDEATQTVMAAMNEALDGHPFPPNAATLIGVERLGNASMRIEVSAIAALPE